MGYVEIDIKVPVHSQDSELKNIIRRKTGFKEYSYTIIKKSLDARQKRNIYWLYRIGIVSSEIKHGKKPEFPTINPEFKKRGKKVLMVGTGPAGIFSALLFSMAGFGVTIIERGGKVEGRKKSINNFEKTGLFDPQNNYSFGEGGAGTFSDGKLTSRTKNISPERNFIFQQLIEAGAPQEIMYMTHPHLGSDNLFTITQNLRKNAENRGCEFLFNTSFEGFEAVNEKIIHAKTSVGNIAANYYFVAAGHSAYDTYRMLMSGGVKFQAKNFAIGFRAEHKQEIINVAQWGVSHIPGVKAADYRLTAQSSDNTPIYSFCMCPGGIVVPAAPYSHTNIVNGMSNYKRDNLWANAAVVAGVNLNKILGREVSAEESLDWLENLEASFYSFSGGYNAPACRIIDFLNNRTGSSLPKSSYPFELVDADYFKLLPKPIIVPLKEGLINFCQKLKGYDTGIILGLESKTSSPVQVLRDQNTFTSGFSNLYIVGEGSGWAGGIISSAADGLKAAQRAMET